MAKTEWLTLVQQREVKRQEILSGEQETMRQKLEDHARLEVIDYRKGWKQHLPTAKIHPFVWIEFAEQVQEGKVDAVLTTSLQRILCPELSRFVRGHEYYHTQSLARDAYLAGKSD